MSDFNDGILPTPCLRMDTHFGDEYESVEFGDGTGYIKAAPILAKVGALHGEIDRLQDEDAKLWEQGERLFDKTLELETENAKLRELVQNLYACINHRNCDDCEYVDEACEFERSMCELGVKV